MIDEQDTPPRMFKVRQKLDSLHIQLPLRHGSGKERRGRLRFDTTRGDIELFDGLFLHELEWLHRTIDDHTQRLRLSMQEDGYDTEVAARPPEAITRLLS